MFQTLAYKKAPLNKKIFELYGYAGTPATYILKKDDQSNIKPYFLNSGHNPPNGIIINYYLPKEINSKMYLEIKDKNNYNFPYAQDPGSKLATEFGATKTPHIYLFDNNDMLVYRGAIDDNARNARSVDEPFLANAIDQLLSDSPIEKPISKAIGCSIKFP